MVVDSLMDAPQDLLLLNPDLPKVVQVLFTVALTIWVLLVPIIISVALLIVLNVTALLMLSAEGGLLRIARKDLCVARSQCRTHFCKAAVQSKDECLVILGFVDDCRNHNTADFCERLLREFNYRWSCPVSEHVFLRSPTGC